MTPLEEEPDALVPKQPRSYLSCSRNASNYRLMRTPLLVRYDETLRRLAVAAKGHTGGPRLAFAIGSGLNKPRAKRRGEVKVHAGRLVKGAGKHRRGIVKERVLKIDARPSAPRLWSFAGRELASTRRTRGCAEMRLC